MLYTLAFVCTDMVIFVLWRLVILRSITLTSTIHLFMVSILYIRQPLALLQFIATALCAMVYFSLCNSYISTCILILYFNLIFSSLYTIYYSSFSPLPTSFSIKTSIQFSILVFTFHFVSISIYELSQIPSHWSVASIFLYNGVYIVINIISRLPI